MKVCVLIPTYNENLTIGALVEKIHRQNLDVIVIDDGSIDNTETTAKENGAVVIRNPSNEGKGASLIKGFQYALDNGFEAIITMDGDGQHLPREIPRFLQYAQNSDADIIIGNRMSDVKNMPAIRILTNKFMSWMISRIARQKIPDTQCGYRLLKRTVLEKLTLHTSKFETESEILIKASRLKFKISSINIESVYVKEKSHINPIRDTFRFIRFILKQGWYQK